MIETDRFFKRHLKLDLKCTFDTRSAYIKDGRMYGYVDSWIKDDKDDTDYFIPWSNVLDCDHPTMAYICFEI